MIFRDASGVTDQVAVDSSKQKKEGKGSKKASRGSTPATDAATTSGGEEAEDRWDFECIECGQSGDPLLCCEVCAGQTLSFPQLLYARVYTFASAPCQKRAWLLWPRDAATCQTPVAWSRHFRCQCADECILLYL